MSIQVGRISAIDYEKGLARVVYADRDNTVTPPIPMLAEQYHMPQVGDLVLVAQLTNGFPGVILGRYWTEKHSPVEGRENTYRHDLDNIPGQAVVRWDRESQTLTISTTGKLTLQAGELVLSADAIRLDSQSITGGPLSIRGDAITLSGSAITARASSVQTTSDSMTLTGGAVQVSGSVTANGEVIP